MAAWVVSCHNGTVKSSRPLASLGLFLAMAASCAAQTAQPPEKKATPKPAPASFVCPDPQARQACKSYEELLKAKDSGLPNVDYVCFHKRENTFFVVQFLKPSDATERGRGFVYSYKDGVEDSSVMPSLSFSGTWKSGLFSADSINHSKLEANDSDVGISIDESQIKAGYKYENNFEKTIQYSLTIQRSAGQFTESFREEPAKFVFLEKTGRCIFRKNE